MKEEEKLKGYPPEWYIVKRLFLEMKGKEYIDLEDFVDDLSKELAFKYSSNAHTMVKYYLNKLEKLKMIKIMSEGRRKVIRLTDKFPLLTEGGYLYEKTFCPANVIFGGLIVSFITFLAALFIGEFIPFIFSLIFLTTMAVSYFSFRTISLWTDSRKKGVVKLKEEEF